MVLAHAPAPRSPLAVVEKLLTDSNVIVRKQHKKQAITKRTEENSERRIETSDRRARIFHQMQRWKVNILVQRKKKKKK